MAVKKSRDRLVQELRRFIEGNASRQELAAAAAHYNRVTRVKLQPALRQLVDVMMTANTQESPSAESSF